MCRVAPKRARVAGWWDEAPARARDEGGRERERERDERGKGRNNPRDVMSLVQRKS